MSQEEYFQTGLKSVKQTGICHKGKNVSSIAFKFEQTKRPGEVFRASVLCQHFLSVLYKFRVLDYIYTLDLGYKRTSDLFFLFSVWKKEE